MRFLKGRRRLLLGHVHLIVGSRVQHDLGIQLRQHVLHFRRIGDVGMRTAEALHLIASRRKFRPQFRTELSGAPENRDFFHSFIIGTAIGAGECFCSFARS